MVLALRAAGSSKHKSWQGLEPSLYLSSWAEAGGVCTVSGNPTKTPGETFVFRSFPSWGITHTLVAVIRHREQGGCCSARRLGKAHGGGLMAFG